MEFCYVSHPFLIRSVDIEITLQNIRRSFTDIAAVGIVSLYANTTEQTQLGQLAFKQKLQIVYIRAETKCL